MATDRLEKELRERPQWIAEIAADIEERKPARIAMKLGNCVFARARAGLKIRGDQPAELKLRKHVGRPTGMTEDRIEEGKKLEELIEKYGGKRGAVKRAAIEVYRGVRADLAYDRARQTRKDYGRWKTTNREKNRAILFTEINHS